MAGRENSVGYELLLATGRSLWRRAGELRWNGNGILWDIAGRSWLGLVLTALRTYVDSNERSGIHHVLGSRAMEECSTLLSV